MLRKHLAAGVFMVVIGLPGAMGKAAGAGDPTLLQSISRMRDGTLKELSNRFLVRGDTEGFWSAVRAISAAGGYPILETVADPAGLPPDYVSLTFLHRHGAVAPENVLLFANINRVVPSELLFERIGRTDVYFKPVDVPRSVRFEYRIIENDPLTGLFAGAKYGTRIHLLGGDPDPLNPRKRVIPDGLGKGQDYIQTWVELPGAAPQPYIEDRGNPRGEIRLEDRNSLILGYSRRTVTYLPPGYDPGHTYHMMILLDGTAYFEDGHLRLTLDNLIAEGLIPPLVVLGIDAGVSNGVNRRNDEFTCSPSFIRVLLEELLPWFTSSYSVTDEPGERIIAGSSFGGLFAACFAFQHPEAVAHVLSQSGSFHWGRKEDPVPFEWLVREFAFAERRPISLDMEVGLLEGEYSWRNPEFPHQIVSHRHFKTILDMRGYEVAYHEYRGSHEMLSWRGGIAEGLKRIFGRMAPR